MADDFPWPEKSGYKIRLGNIVRALAEVGELDLFIRMPFGHTGSTAIPADTAMHRVLVVQGDPPRSTSRMLLRWATTRLPRMLARADWTSTRHALESWVEGPYDLVWYGHADSIVELGGIVDAPGIVDLDNLEDQRIEHLRRARAGRRDQIRSRGRALVARTFDRFDQHRWARLQRRIAARVQAVTLCSDLDRARLGTTNVEVLPNGYELPEGAPVNRPKPDPAAPVIGMVGLLTYEPNADGVWFFLDDILPLIRVELPGTRVKLIGRYDGFVSEVGEREGVELCGEVPDIATALADVDVIVVPVRFGAGTRIKVLEAFAREIPVVSTTVGCEGIPVENGGELLIADDAAGFARACVDLVRDEALRTRVVARGAALWQEQFRWSDLRPRIADLANRAAASTPPAARPPAAGPPAAGPRTGG